MKASQFDLDCRDERTKQNQMNPQAKSQKMKPTKQERRHHNSIQTIGMKEQSKIR